MLAAANPELKEKPKKKEKIPKNRGSMGFNQDKQAPNESQQGSQCMNRFRDIIC
jgi:hypothetical protein